MKEKELNEIIQEVVKEREITTEQVESELKIYLQEKYLITPQKMLKDAIIQQAKELIVSQLYNSTNCEISEGWNNYTTVPSYKSLLHSMLAPAHRLYFDQIIDELLEEELIYTKTYTGDKEPKVVGLTEKGILFKAEMDLNQPVNFRGTNLSL
ncbi:hypothetical protein [uncultured Draconibacterium sp.]|uniref:hypothetical protein n=1 Tax=uncultured Draconibacterium sp. TaxID=1573823 RepID=UPI0025F9376D|nr:hypothetical protein [uncultured Draconibacterium sp.]